MINSPKISIIILTKNAGINIRKCLSGIFSQETSYFYEVIVIDSGSIDETLEITKEYPVRLINIKPEEFGHGKTRNFGANLAKGEYLIYLVQDAYPANQYWLKNLVKNMEDEKVAGAYSRWMPKENCNPIEANSIYEFFPSLKRVANLESINEYCKETSNLFSNVSSCIRKKFLAHIPFNNDIVFAEDREWFIKVIKAGYTIVYEPNSIVYHSHNYSLKYNFKRAFDFGISSNKWEGQLNLENKISFFDLLFRFFNHIYRDYIFMKRNKISLKFKWLSYGAIWRFAIFIAQWLGAHYKYLPKTIRKKLSTAPQMFNKQ